MTQLENNPLLSPEHIQNWSHIVPPFSSGASVVSQGFVQALTATGRADVLQQFNIPLIHAMCAVLYPEFSAKPSRTSIVRCATRTEAGRPAH